MVPTTSNRVVRFLLPLAVTAGLFTYLASFLSHNAFIESVFLRAWYIQAFNTWLFLIALMQWWRSQDAVNRERQCLRELRFPTNLGSQLDEFIERVPDLFEGSLVVRRMRDILNASRSRSDVDTVAKTLAELDEVRLERGHLVLNSLRSVIPAIGFLGTVLGLSLGLLQFPDVSDVDSLRNALKEFAASLSIAFTTTLLALFYAIILILSSAVLRDREHDLLESLNDKVRALIDVLNTQAKAKR